MPVVAGVNFGAVPAFAPGAWMFVFAMGVVFGVGYLLLLGFPIWSSSAGMWLGYSATFEVCCTQNSGNFDENLATVLVGAPLSLLAVAVAFQFAVRRRATPLVSILAAAALYLGFLYQSNAAEAYFHDVHCPAVCAKG
jgi:hypothetical protein